MVATPMAYGLLLSTLLALSSTLSLPTTPTFIHPTTQNGTLIALSPWPRAPYRILIAPPFGTPHNPCYLTIQSYGSPGPRNTNLAGELLAALSDQVYNIPDRYGLIRNRIFQVEGLKATFTEAGRGHGFGITRLQAARLVHKVFDLTGRHGAVGVQRGDVEVGGRVVERFELVWMFE